MADQNEETHLSSVEASGGVKTGAMRYVLAISLALVIVIFGVILLRPFG